MPRGVYKRTEETRNNMSRAAIGKHSGRNNGMYGKHGIDNPNYGRTRSEKTKARLRQINSGDNHPGWKGGRIIHEGYIQIWKPDHPHHDNKGYVLEHRLVMEKMIGRYLTKDEVVHHINGIKNDNRIENLRILTNGEHMILEKTIYGADHICIRCKTDDAKTRYNGTKIWRRGMCRRCYDKIRRA